MRTDTNFIAELKETSGSEQEHVPHFLHKNVNRKFLDVSRCTHSNQRQGNVQKSVLQLDPLLFFTILGIQRLFSAKHLFGEANFA